MMIQVSHRTLRGFLRGGIGAVLFTVLAAGVVQAQSSGSQRRQPAYTPAAQPGSSQKPGSGQKGSAMKGSDQRGSGAAATGAGSGSAMKGEAEAGLQGFCPVCVVELSKWVKGDPRFSSVVDGKAYYFPDQDIQAKFNANPNKYLPVLGGDDVVTYVQTGQRRPASLAYGVLHGGRPFFFASEANKRQFMASPALYSTADLAMSGDCVVCRVDIQQKMPGSPATTVVHNGVRYQFVGMEQQKRFMMNPMPYVAAAATAGPSTGSGSQGSGNHGSATQPGSGTQSGSGSHARPRPPAGSGSGGR